MGVKTETQKTKTKSDVIWNQIKNLKLELFALPDEVVDKHFERMEVTDDEVHLKLKNKAGMAVIPALVEALQSIKLARGEGYNVEETKDYLIVTTKFEEPENKESFPPRRRI